MSRSSIAMILVLGMSLHVRLDGARIQFQRQKLMSGKMEESAIILGTVCVKVDHAVGLPDLDGWWDTSDPFVEVTVGSETRSTPHKNGDHNPIWNWESCFSVDSHASVIGLKLYDHDSLIGILDHHDHIHTVDNIEFRSLDAGSWIRYTRIVQGGGSFHFHLKWTPVNDGGVDGKVTTADKSGGGDGPSASYICFLKYDAAGKKTDLLARVKTDKNWEPDNAMSDSMPMFLGTMTNTLVQYLQSQPEVEFCEADSVMTISK